MVMVALSCFYYFNYTYVVFEPITMNATSEKQVEVPSDKAFHKRLAFILEKEGQDYLLDDSGSVLIQRQIARDKDWIYTFTGKAMDSAWIKVLLKPEKRDSVMKEGSPLPKK
jgi:hypothetical protein